MTTLCMADYSEPPVRATAILHDTQGLWAALTNHASSREGAELAGVLQAIAEHSAIVHRLIYDIASRDIELAASTHREAAQLLVGQEVSQSRLHRSANQKKQKGVTELRLEKVDRRAIERAENEGMTLHPQ